MGVPAILAFLLGCGTHGSDRRAEPDVADVGDGTDTACTVCDTSDTATTPDTTDTADSTLPTWSCGDGTCDADESCSTCEADCGACPAACGDGTCDPGESCWDCTTDCGECDCPTDAQVIVYTQSAWNVLADAFLADPSPCADYYVSIPANSGDKTTPRAGGEPEAMRARGPRMHAMAEFHWATWSGESGSWYDKGVEFRRRMETAGYDVSAGDTWAINELPSSIRSDDATRRDAEDLFHGLYDGPEGSPPAKGAVFVVGMGQDTANFSVYKPNIEDWLEDAGFWEQANLYVAYWGQEVYTDPDETCVAGTTVAERSAEINAFIEHFARHAEVGPSSVNTAQTYLGRAYVPLMNAVWGSSGGGYGSTAIPLEQMEHHVSGQIYAARAWSNTHAYPDARVGLAWAREDVDDTDLATLAARVASAIHYAYDEGGGSAAGACSPSGAYTWCQCEVDGAAFNDGWSTFETW